MIGEERLFEHFIDSVDGVLCLSAASDAVEIERLASPHGLRFPLLLDRTTPLDKQVESSAFAPASSRYGPYCDNITGMNWELPDGRRVRVGERVVKSTTGYDLIRFLLASGNRYGCARDYLLRLRPACDTSRVFCLRGQAPALQTALKSLLHSSWIHWLDSVDLVAGDFPFLRVAIHCPWLEFEAYMDFLSGFAKQFDLALEPMDEPALDGCPDLVVKTTPEFVADMALSLSRHPGAKCIALCPCGVVHVFLPDRYAIGEIVRPLEPDLHAMGGHWQSRHISPGPSPLEASWISTLCKEWRIS